MDVLCFPICLDQFLISGHMCKDSQLDLRIIRIQEHESVFRHKNLTDQSSKFHPDRNILKIRFCTADPSGCRNRLIKGRMNPSVCFDHSTQSICIGRFKLGKLAVFQDILDDLMLRRKLLQNVCRCRVTCLCLLASRDLHLFKQDHTQLLRGIDIEFFTCLLPDQLFQFMDTDTQFLTVILQFLASDTDSPFLHGIQGEYQRKLDFCINLPHFCLMKSFFDRCSGRKDSVRHITGIGSQSFQRFLPGCPEGIFT